jgi:hypothetical protein
MNNSNLKKYLAEGKLLKENTNPIWTIEASEDDADISDAGLEYIRAVGTIIDKALPDISIEDMIASMDVINNFWHDEARKNAKGSEPEEIKVSAIDFADSVIEHYKDVLMDKDINESQNRIMEENKITENKITNNKMKKQILSEEFRRMQLLAGVINESQLDEGETWIDGIWGTGNYKELIHKIENIFQEGGNGASFKCFGKDFTITKTKGGRFLITSSTDFGYEALDINGAFIAAKEFAGTTNESQLNEGWDDFNATGWQSRIKDIAKEMGYDAEYGWDDQNTDRARLKAADEAEKGEKKAYIGTVDDGNTIVVTFTLDKDNKDQNKANIQKKIVDLYKKDANVTLGNQTHNDTLMQVIIKDKTK